MFQTPPVPSVKPAVTANAKFFIPAPAPSSSEQTMEAIAENNQEDSSALENPSTSSRNDWAYLSPKTPSPMARQRFPSMGNIPSPGAMINGSNSHHTHTSPHSRRTASWSGGSYGDSFYPTTKMNEVKPLGEALGMPPSTFMPDDASLMHTPVKSGSFGDLHEVEL